MSGTTQMNQVGEASPASSLAPSRYRILRTGLRNVSPYLAILPALVTFLILLGYPLVLLVKTSFQQYGYFEIINHVTTWVGLDNYAQVLFAHPAGLPDFPTVLVRTTVFMLVNVFLTMFLGTLIAVLMERMHKWTRLVLSAAMVLAWAVPALTGSVVFQWLFDYKLGVVNWAISSLGIFGDYFGHSWFDTGFSTFIVITMLIVWQAIPFVAFSLYAGLLAVPKELPESARVDGATERQIFLHVKFPALRTLFMMLVFLSVIWDFKVFTQIYTFLQGGPDNETTTLSVYTYIVGIAQGKYGYAAAASVVMMLLLLIVLVPYIRRMIRSQEEA